MYSEVSFDLLTDISDFFVCIDAQGVIRQTFDCAESFLQLPAGLLLEPVEQFIQPEDAHLLQKAIDAANETGQKQSFSCRFLRQKVLPVWVDCYLLKTDADQFLLIAFDASHWVDNEQHFISSSIHDLTTGLPGRTLLDDRLVQNIQIAERENRTLAVMMIGLDGIKKVYDLLGSAIGDQLIRMVVDRLQRYIRACDTLTRSAFEEFSLILIGMGHVDINGFARKMLLTLQRPFRINEHTLNVSMSVGFSIYPEHGEQATLLYKNAEIAKHRAKSQGKNQCKVYSKNFHESERKNLSLESAMYEGIENGEFFLEYQPVFGLLDGKLKGAEALMRWNSSSFGFVSPAKFIPLAETSGLINLLGTWALRSACYQVKQWQQQTEIEEFHISVNVSPYQFIQEDFSDMVSRALVETGLDSSHLVLEITEGVLMENPIRSSEILASLYALGIRISIDDFGTGYSSMAYLKRFPLSILKIDRSFVEDVTKSKQDKAIVDAIIRLAKGLEMTVVAEGVENKEQLHHLKMAGCDLVQGYFTGKPIHSSVFLEKFC